MNIKEYQKFVRDSANPIYDNELALLGLIGEVGEVSDVIKKNRIYADMDKFQQKYGMSVQEKIIDECGDVLWQFVELLNVNNIDIEDLAQANYIKLISRHGGVKTDVSGGSR